MKKVLVVGERNSSVSQMFEEYVRMYGDGDYIVESAGVDPAEAVDESTIEVMNEEGLDLTGKTVNNVFDLYNAGLLYDYVITVSDQAADKCPVFPGFAHRRYFSLPDHMDISGDWRNGDLEKKRAVREAVKRAVRKFIDEDALFPAHGRWRSMHRMSIHAS